jgi:hypothetical protein
MLWDFKITYIYVNLNIDKLFEKKESRLVHQRMYYCVEE